MSGVLLFCNPNPPVISGVFRHYQLCELRHHTLSLSLITTEEASFPSTPLTLSLSPLRAENK
jgi:hypothetical protein